MSSKRLDRFVRFVASSNFARTAAVLATASGVQENVTEGADLFFDSGPITSNNVVGWDPDGQLMSFDFQASAGRLFQFVRNTYNDNKYVALLPYQLNVSTFQAGTDTAARGGLNFGLEFFNFGDKWTSAVVGVEAGGYAGILTFSTAVGEVSPEQNVYFLFKFEEAGTPYYGWIDADILVEGFSTVGSNYVRINRYAWQSSTLGVLEAGATPVPEPSTLATSGVAALAGGAIALRRWRKERPAPVESA